MTKHYDPERLAEIERQHARGPLVESDPDFYQAEYTQLFNDRAELIAMVGELVAERDEAIRGSEILLNCVTDMASIPLKLAEHFGGKREPDPTGKEPQ